MRATQSVPCAFGEAGGTHAHAGTGPIYTPPSTRSNALVRRAKENAACPRSLLRCQPAKPARARRHGKSAACGKAKHGVFTRFGLAPEMSKFQGEKKRNNNKINK